MNTRPSALSACPRNRFALRVASAICALALAGAGGPAFAQAASIDDLIQTEGNTGMTDFVLTVTLDAVPYLDVSVDWVTEDGSANSPDDFTASSGTVLIPAGDTTGTLTVPVVADRIEESQEYFRVHLSNPVNCSIGDGTARAYIANDDVSASVADITQAEGNTGMTDFVLTVTLTGDYEFDIWVDWVTEDGSARSPDDFTASSGTVFIPSGDTTGTITVPVVADRNEESQEYFRVHLSNPVSCSIGDGTARAYIANDDVSASVADITQTEGNTGMTDFVLTVTLSGTYEFDIWVDWVTEDGSARSPDDFTASSGTVFIPSGDTTGTIAVPVVADRIEEALEYFRVHLSNPVSCSIGDGTARANIVDDDVSASVADITQAEGSTGMTDFVLTVTLSGTYGFDIWIDWVTEDESAHSPDDYTASSGTVFIPSGDTTGTITVPVVADRVQESLEYFFVHLSNPVSCSISDGTARVNIVDDDVSVSVADITQDEGSTGMTDFVFTVTLDAISDFDVSVDWVTEDGSADSPDDYTASSGAVVIPSGDLTGTITVPVVADRIEETEEYFRIHLSNPVNCSIYDGTARANIVDDDVSASVADITQTEGNTGMTDFVLTVTLSGIYEFDVSVDWVTEDGTAVEPDDYTASSGTVFIPSGDLTGTITVPVVADTIEEALEYFLVHLSNPVNCSIYDGTARAYIDNDDLPGGLSVGDAIDWEGDVGTTELVFDVTLDPPSGITVEVDWATADGTALAGEDYVATGGTVVFDPGETLETVSVSVLGDGLDECTEEFFVDLSNPVNGEIGNGQGIGTIETDDLLGCADADADCYRDEACGGRDCDDTDPAIHVDAPEINDGLDNQCPGNPGYGIVDEISGVCGFHDAGDDTEFSWDDQEAAATYEVARSSAADFLADCVMWPATTQPFVYDVEDPLPGTAFFYLVRAASPHVGSWGADGQGADRTFVCPTP
jgi:hypothetical protein